MSTEKVKNNQPHLILVVDNTNTKQLQLLEEKQQQFID